MSFSSDFAKKLLRPHENVTVQLTQNSPYPELMNLVLIVVYLSEL